METQATETPLAQKPKKKLDKLGWALLCMLVLFIILMFVLILKYSAIPQDPCGACEALMNATCLRLEVPMYG